MLVRFTAPPPLHYHLCGVLPSFTLPRRVNFRKHSIRCSISQIHSYGSVDYGRRPMEKWNAVYRKITLMENPDMGTAGVLNQLEKDGKKLTKWELCRVVKELRKFKHFKMALEVYEWMNNRGERFRLSSSDAAVQLDLIAKVNGVLHAEDYFSRCPDTLRDRRIYGALLNAYGQARMREKAKILIEKMINKGYATTALPFNVMMTLYKNLKELNEVESVVSQMLNKNIPLDIYSYNIWLSSCESAEKMEQVFERMKLERSVNPNWTTFSTMATMYIRLGQFEMAEECLRKAESRITGRDRLPYHYLISLYGSTGNEAEIYRVWDIYKSRFPNIPNLGYLATISSLLRVGDIEGANKIYEEWLPNKLSYDPRIGNLLLGWYVKEGLLEKAEGFLDHMIEAGGKPNSSTWEILVEGNISVKKISDALSCFKKAILADGSDGWKPKPGTLSAFLNLCQEEADGASKEALMGLLRQKGCLEDEIYTSLLGLSNEKNRTGAYNDIDMDEAEDDGAEMLLNQFQSSL